MAVDPAIRYYSDGEEVTEGVLNRPLTDIEANLTSIYEIVDGVPSYSSDDANKYVRVSPDGTGLVYSELEFEPIRTPTAISPLTGTTNVPVAPLLEASPYAPIYSADSRSYREFQVDFEAGDWTSLFRSHQVNADSWNIDPDISAYPTDTFKWRCRDVSIKGDVSAWSEPQIFSSSYAFVRTPSISVQKDGSLAYRAPVLTGSVFEVFGAEDGNHASTDWRITRTSDNTVVWSSIGDTANLETITVPDQTLTINTEYKFELRYHSDIYGSSTWVSTTATVVGYYEKTPALSGETSGVEAEDHVITIDDYNATLTYVINVSGGSASRSGSTILWDLPLVSQNTTHQIDVYAVNQYAEQSSTASFNVTVLNIPTENDDAVIITSFTQNVYNDGWRV